MMICPLWHNCLFFLYVPEQPITLTHIHIFPKQTQQFDVSRSVKSISSPDYCQAKPMPFNISIIPDLSTLVKKKSIFTL